MTQPRNATLLGVGTRRTPPSLALVSPSAPVTGSIATKRTLASLSFAVERVAHDVGSDAVVIALFQRGAYFAPRAAAYVALADLGIPVIVMYAGEGEVAPGVVQVPLDDDDPRAHEWSVIALSPTFGAYVIGTDLDELDPAGRTMEDRRRFRASWGFDRAGAAVHARRLLAESRDSIPSDLADRVDAAIAAATVLPTTAAEVALGRAALCLVASLDDTSVELDDASARLDRETQHATRDQLTGLTNREGLERWLGGTALHGVDMPLIGVVMIDLDGFKAVNDTHGHDTGDQLLQAVAGALTSCTRPGDLVTRLGGDEFVVLCPGAEGEQLNDIASCMVAAVAGTSIGDAKVGASVGTQSCRYRPLPMAATDAAMYAAKRAGGGRVVAA
jgi:diguanylate cyclase (GGDEF)-like protein